MNPEVFPGLETKSPQKNHEALPRHQEVLEAGHQMVIEQDPVDLAQQERNRAERVDSARSLVEGVHGKIGDSAEVESVESTVHTVNEKFDVRTLSHDLKKINKKIVKAEKPRRTVINPFGKRPEDRRYMPVVNKENLKHPIRSIRRNRKIEKLQEDRLDVVKYGVPNIEDSNVLDMQKELSDGDKKMRRVSARRKYLPTRKLRKEALSAQLEQVADVNTDITEKEAA